MAVVYIDPTVSGTGTGTFPDPFKSWSSVTWTAGNDYLQKEGTTFVGTIIVGTSGTSNTSRVTLGTYDAATGAKIEDMRRAAKINANGAQFGIHTNFTIRNFVSIIALEVYGARHATSAIGIYWPTGNGTDLIVKNCYVHDIKSTSTPNGNTQGIKFFSDRAKIIGNLIEDISDDGIQGEGDDVEVAYNIVRLCSVDSTFGDCIQLANATISTNNPWIHHNWCDHRNIDSKQCIIFEASGAAGGTGGLIEHNECYGYVGVDALHKTMYASAANIIVRRNRLYGGGWGLQMAELCTGSAVAESNLIKLKPEASSRGLVVSAAGVTVQNNTVVALGKLSGTAGIDQQNYASVTIRNNIVVGWTNGIRVHLSNPATDANNAYFDCTLNKVSEANVSQSLGAGAVTTDPLLSTDYRPLPGSPLLSSGADLGYIRDIEGRQSKKHIGAYGAAKLIRDA